MSQSKTSAHYRDCGGGSQRKCLSAGLLRDPGLLPAAPELAPDAAEAAGAQGAPDGPHPHTAPYRDGRRRRRHGMEDSFVVFDLKSNFDGF